MGFIISQMEPGKAEARFGWVNENSKNGKNGIEDISVCRVHLLNDKREPLVIGADQRLSVDLKTLRRLRRAGFLCIVVAS